MRSLPALAFSLRRVAALFLAPLLLMGCDFESTVNGNDSRFDTSNCELQLQSGCSGADCIPSIDGIASDDDRLVDAADVEGLVDTSRVIGLPAVPHSVLWSHEVVNVDDWTDHSFAVTYCPLTGSSLAFDRSTVGGAEFGLSGLLFQKTS